MQDAVYEQGPDTGAGAVELVAGLAHHPQARAFHNARDANRNGNNDK